MNVAEAICSRRSVRAFLPTPVPRHIVEEILKVAANAPSGSNIQPWHVWVVSGTARDRLVDRIQTVFAQDEPGHAEEYTYYPAPWFEPLLARRRQLGKTLYSLTNVPKGDVAAMKRQQGRNYEFFGAPVGMFFTMDRGNGQGAFVDMGGFLQSVMIAARAHGLHTCPQQSFSKFHKLVREFLPIPDSHLLLCGMALGFEDKAAKVNELVAVREPVESFARFFEE